jgi:hypothetical protein
MAETVTVEIVSISSQMNPPASRLEYEVRNYTSAPIWLVDDGWLIWRQAGKEIELCYARGKMRPGAQVFGYFPPSVVKTEPGGSISRVVHLTWPHPLDRLWNAEPNAAPPPGEHQVSVRIGYGVTADPDAPGLSEGVEAPVFRWQREAASTAVPMQVPPYPNLVGESE